MSEPRGLSISQLMELSLCSMLDVGKIDPFEKEFYFARDELKRQWRFDFAWPEKKIALEVEGGVHQGPSRHMSPWGFIGDLHKYNTAAIMGWTVLRVDSSLIRKGYALEYIMDLLNGNGTPTLRVQPGSNGRVYLRSSMRNFHK